MQNRFDNNDFEQFLKENADQYRMFPSEKVWNGIHSTLHTRRRWYGFGLALLLFTTGIVTWVMLTPSAKKQPIADALPVVSANTQPEANEKNDYRISSTVAVLPVIRPANSRPRFEVSSTVMQDDIFSGAPGETIAAVSGSPANEEVSGNTVIEPVEQPAAVVNVAPVQILPESIVKSSGSVNKQIAVQKSRASEVLSPRVNQYSFTVAPKAAVEQKAVQPAVATEENNTLLKPDIYPYTIESVINSYTRIKKRKRVSLQFYVTPTVSYRELKENKPFIEYARNPTNGAQVVYYSVDINNVVTHKPDLGVQLGFSAGYPLSKKLRLIGGLQFNVNKYNIKAYSGATEVATITLDNGAGTNNTVSMLSSYRSNGGSARANWLHNLYFSASAPIGLELKVAGRRKSHVGVAATVQPTYMISNRSYLISTDYKNYAEVPSLTRKWNVNTGFEIFAGYTTGKVDWRIGPNVRYQAMSSFQDKYPVREHLFDFGLKLGVMLNK